jgi:serine phosphatase RsbU (regulator of sigma subunit)
LNIGYNSDKTRKFRPGSFDPVLSVSSSVPVNDICTVIWAGRFLMTDRVKDFFRLISLRQYLIIVIVCIILLVTGFLLIISYYQAEGVVLKLDEYFQEYTEKNIRDRVSLVNTGLDLFDSGLNNQLIPAFDLYGQAYNNSHGNLSAIPYRELKEKIDRNTTGTVDLYVVNRNGMIIRSTVPEVLSLSLYRDPGYVQKLPGIINGSAIVPDRVVNAYSAADAATISGLKKFAFMPTPDHAYLLEIGISDLSFSDVRSNLSYSMISEEMSDINPYLDDIRIFDIHKNLFVKGGIAPAYTLDNVTRARLDEVISARSDMTYLNEDNGSFTQYMFIDLSGDASISDMSVIAEVTYSNTLLAEVMGRIIAFFSGVGLIAIFLGLVLTIWASYIITRPISDIVEDVDQIACGDLDHRIRSMEVREFSRLERSITLMIGSIRTASEEIEHRKTELAIAADIQRGFLPDHIPRIAGFDITAKNIPAREVGGDFYDIIPYPVSGNESRRFGIAIADVSGKGVPAALFMALSRTIVRVTAGNTIPLSDAISAANNYIAADSRSGMFVTLFYGLITEGGSDLSFVNAGHNPPVWYRARDKKAGLLHNGGIVLGVDDSFRFAEEKITLQTGDIIVFYTDGITEAIDAAENQYGEERLCRITETYASESSSLIVHEVLNDLQEFVGSEDQFDDITILVMKKT